MYINCEGREWGMWEYLHMFDIFFLWGTTCQGLNLGLFHAKHAPSPARYHNIYSVVKYCGISLNTSHTKHSMIWEWYRSENTDVDVWTSGFLASLCK